MIMKQYIDRKFNFKEVFNTKTGFYMRSGVLDKNGRDTGVDPFMRSFPGLIDIGIMGSCVHGKSGLCAKAGVQCYQNGLTRYEPNMTLENFKKIADECSEKVFQFALGGRGDPNKHENFEEIMRYSVESGIIPNYTTSGLALTDKEVEITKKYAGAVAVSYYRNKHTYRALDMFIKAGVTTNIHYVLGNNTIDEAIDKLKNDGFNNKVNAIIFLLHKPIGQGLAGNMLKNNDPKVQEFFDIIDNQRFDFQIGFDSCTIPGLLNNTKNISPASIDTCEAARWSMYITSDMIALPCSFDNDDLKWGYDISKDTIKNAWNSKEFNNIRNYFTNSCVKCPSRSECMGGCPIVRDIVLCDRKEKDLYVG